MTSPIFEIDSNVSHVALTNQGIAVGFFGFIHEAHVRIEDANFFLCQDGLRLSASRKLLVKNLIDPVRPGKVTTGYTHHLDGGFYVSLDFQDEALHTGQYWVEAEIEWNNRIRKTIRLLWLHAFKHTPFLNVPKVQVAVAMATYNPDICLFERQIRSLKAQDLTSWICLISDDASDERIRQAMQSVVADDNRFYFISHKTNCGLYRNFERLLSYVPNDVEYIALCDQDDFWHVTKLSESVRSLKRTHAGCVYSDCELVTSSDISLGLLSRYRPLAYSGFWSLLSANVATGMTMVMTRKVLETSLPFPSCLKDPYHDHWIALVATKTGGLSLLNRVLGDYTQHDGNHTGARHSHRSTLSILFANIYLLTEIVTMPLKKNSGDENIKTLRRFNDTYRNDKVRYLVMLNSVLSRTGANNISYKWGLIVWRLFVSGLGSSDRYRRGVVVDIMVKSLIDKLLTSYVGRRR